MAADGYLGENGAALLDKVHGDFDGVVGGPLQQQRQQLQGHKLVADLRGEESARRQHSNPRVAPLTCWLTRCAMYLVQAMHTTLSLRLYARRNCMITRLSSNSPISGICRRDHRRASTSALREKREATRLRVQHGNERRVDVREAGRGHLGLHDRAADETSAAHLRRGEPTSVRRVRTRRSAPLHAQGSRGTARE